MATLSELRQVRIEKLEKLKTLGVDPFPPTSYKSHSNIVFHESFEKLEGNEVVASGRIVSIRKHGKLAFIDLKDATGKIQLYIKEDALLNPDHTKSEIGFEELNLLDSGDFAEGKGILTKTQRGEVSVEVTSIRILTKSLRPLPDMWDGLKDKETRLRRRYIDTNINPDVYQSFIRTSKFWEAHRDFFKKQGFMEMNIPVLETTPGGADANPFVTHMDVLDQDFYLRISQELYLKRLIGGGYEKVYEIGPRFRNEGISDEHLPEHIAMEFYWAYADWNDGMKFIKNLFRYVAEEVYGTQKFEIKGFNVDFGKEWEIIDYSEIFKEKFGLDIFNSDFDDAKKILEKKHIKIDKNMNFGRGVDSLWKTIRKDIQGPAFVVNEPKFLSPLAKANPSNPKYAMRFHPIVAGGELGNGFSELNDPVDQYERFKEQQSMRDSGDAEAQFLDIDFVEMLEYGMPPTLGYGHSERVFWFLENVSAREGVPFPQLRHEIDSVTKGIYGLE